MEKQHELRSKVFSVLPFAGPVQIKRAQQRFVLLDNYIPRGSSSGGATDVLEHTYLGREIVDGTSRAYVGNDDLKRRTFLGPTSLPSEISLIMANMAQVRVSGAARGAGAAVPWSTPPRTFCLNPLPFFPLTASHRLPSLPPSRISGEASLRGPGPVRRHRLHPHRLRKIRGLLHGHGHRHPYPKVGLPNLQ